MNPFDKMALTQGIGVQGYGGTIAAAESPANLAGIREQISILAQQCTALESRASKIADLLEGAEPQSAAGNQEPRHAVGIVSEIANQLGGIDVIYNRISYHLSRIESRVG